MFERILFPTDFSVYANAVTACLPSFLSAGVKEVILLHVLRSKDDSSAKKNHRESDQYTRWNAEEQLNLIRMVMESHGLSARTRIEYGSPMAEIIRVAHDERASMIVVGSQMTTLAQEMMAGSTAFQIIRRSHIPVLLLKAEGCGRKAISVVAGLVRKYSSASCIPLTFPPFPMGPTRSWNRCGVQACKKQFCCMCKMNAS